MQHITLYIFFIFICIMYGCGEGTTTSLNPGTSANDTSNKTAISSTSMIDEYHQKCTDLGGAKALVNKNICLAGLYPQDCEPRYQASLAKIQIEWETRSGIAISYLKQCIVMFNGSEYATPSCVAEFNTNMNYVVQDCTLYL